MTWSDRLAPSSDDFAVLAKQAFDALPDAFRELNGDVAIQVDDYPADEVLDSLGLEDPFELTSLYQGVDLRRRSAPGDGDQPPRVFLYRRPILDVWAERGDVALGDLIAHLLVHELGKVGAIVEQAPVASGQGWTAARAPSLEDFVEVAERALGDLPPAIRAAVGDVQIRVEEFADDETLDALEIDDAFELTGVYEGVDLTRRSVLDSAIAPSCIRLFRRPILDEWSGGDVGFHSLVEHVLIHEIAHHFGFSDAGIDHVERS